jgi:hypothetical protein
MSTATIRVPIDRRERLWDQREKNRDAPIRDFFAKKPVDIGSSGDIEALSRPRGATKTENIVNYTVNAITWLSASGEFRELML